MKTINKIMLLLPLAYFVSCTPPPQQIHIVEVKEKQIKKKAKPKPKYKVKRRVDSAESFRAVTSPN